MANFHIALVNKHDNHKDYLIGFYGKKIDYPTREKAEEQIALLKQTCGWGNTEPLNFDYVLEEV